MTTTTPPPPDDEGKEWIPPELLSLDQLLAMEFEPLVWTVSGLLARGSCDILAGKPKAGKSRLALALTCAIASGAMALGNREVVPGDVLYMALEDGKRRLKTRIQTMLEFLPDFDHRRMMVSTRWNRLNEGGMEFIEQWVERAPDPALIVIDTLTRIRPATGGKRPLFEQDYDAIGPLSDLAHNRNVGILSVAHTRKAEAEDWLDEVNASTGLTAAVDGTMIFKRKRGSNEAALYVVNRDAEDQQLALLADPESGGWLYAGDAEAVKLTAARMEILRVLISIGRPMKTGDIAGAVEKPYPTVTGMLYRMLDDHLVVRTDWGTFSAAPDAIARLELKNAPINPINPVNGSGSVYRNGQKAGSLSDLSIYSSDSENEVPF
jgi:hypothetical protein